MLRYFFRSRFYWPITIIARWIAQNKCALSIIAPAQLALGPTREASKVPGNLDL